MDLEVEVGLPGAVARRVKELGIDIESMVSDLILKELSLDPGGEVEACLDLALQFLDEDRRLVDELEKAVERISDRVGKWFEDAWNHAWVLHVWGFHEAKLDVEAVRRLPYVEKMVEEAKRIASSSIVQ